MAEAFSKRNKTPDKTDEYSKSRIESDFFSDKYEGDESENDDLSAKFDHVDDASKSGDKNKDVENEYLEVEGNFFSNKHSGQNTEYDDLSEDFNGASKSVDKNTDGRDDYPKSRFGRDFSSEKYKGDSKYDDLSEYVSGASKSVDKKTDVEDKFFKLRVERDFFSDKYDGDSKYDDLLEILSGASKSIECKFDYVVIDDEETLKESLKSINEMTKDDPLLALDCEGDKLSRDGKIQLVSIATRSKAFIIDTQALKTAAFEMGVRDILEKEDIKKLMFDCREDSDALFHQFNVKLDGIVDIQLLEVIKRSTTPPTGIASRRCDRNDGVVRLKGLLSCAEEYIKDKDIVGLKQRASTRMSDWGKRPFEKELLEYSTVDVMSLFLLFDKLHPDGEEMNRLEIGSKIYVDIKRSIPHRTYDTYEKNCYLPIAVIPDKGRTGFDYGHISCTKCTRMFPRGEFSKRQLKKRIQLCRTCKKVKQDIDREENMRRQQEMEDDMYSCYSDDDDW